jgi:hypothetical protein
MYGVPVNNNTREEIDRNKLENAPEQVDAFNEMMLKEPETAPAGAVALDYCSPVRLLCNKKTGRKIDRFILLSVPNGSRTRVAGVKGRCPRPLDDGDVR